MAVDTNGKWYIGTDQYQTWAPAPSSGMQRARSRYSASLEYENGGSGVVSSSGSSLRYGMDFPVQDASQYDGLEIYPELAAGRYGTGCVYVVDPLWMDQNLFNQVWAEPGLIQAGAKDFTKTSANDTSVTFSSATNPYGKPSVSAQFSLTGAANAKHGRSFKFIIPPNYSLYLGGSGSTTGTAVLRAQSSAIGAGLTNDAINPSPQVNSNGYVTNGMLATGRVAGAGVGGGYGFVGTAGVTQNNAFNGAGFGNTSSARDIGVTPGQTVYPSMYVKANHARSTKFRYTFWDAAGVSLSTYYDTMTGVDLVANASHVRVVGSPQVAPAGADRMQILAVRADGLPWGGTRTNLILDPQGYNATNWRIANGTSSSVSGAALGAANARRATWTAAATASILSSVAGTTILANTSYAVSITIVSSTDLTAATVAYRPTWNSSTGGVNIATNVTFVAGVPQTFTAVINTGVTAPTATAGISIIATNGITAGGTLDASIAHFEASTVVQVPFDGSTIETGRTFAWTGTANASTSTRSGDSLTVDRVSTALGPYFDGSAEFPGATWTGAAYASTSVLTYSNTDISLSANSAAPSFTTTLSGNLYKYVDVYLTRTSTAASTVTLNSLWAQILPDGVAPSLTRHIPGKGVAGMRFSGDAIPEEYIMADRHLIGLSAELTETEPWEYL